MTGTWKGEVDPARTGLGSPFSLEFKLNVRRSITARHKRKVSIQAQSLAAVARVCSKTSIRQLFTRQQNKTECTRYLSTKRTTLSTKQTRTLVCDSLMRPSSRLVTSYKSTSRLGTPLWRQFPGCQAQCSICCSWPGPILFAIPLGGI